VCVQAGGKSKKNLCWTDSAALCSLLRSNGFFFKGHKNKRKGKGRTAYRARASGGAVERPRKPRLPHQPSLCVIAHEKDFPPWKRKKKTSMRECSSCCWLTRVVRSLGIPFVWTLDRPLHPRPPHPCLEALFIFHTHCCCTVIASHRCSVCDTA